MAAAARPGHRLPAWAEGGTVYGVSVSHFSPDGFQGVIDRLDDLADLGITALWLSPINVSPPGDFGYAVVDYFDIRPEYGTKDDFRRLVREAHARGIRVLMDVVPNHTSSAHPWCQETGRTGPASTYWDYYDRDENGQATHYFSWTHLPNLNFDNPEVRRVMTKALLYWVREFDVDGFRVDVAWGIRQRRPDFWPAFAAAFRRLKPDGLLIAEASARDPYYIRNGFDAAYDWTEGLGKWAWEGVFDGDVSVGAAVTDAIAASDPDTPAFRFLNNNDTGTRFVTRHGVDAYRVALAMLMTLPGLPCLYTGDEVGAAFEPYAGTGPIGWDDPHDLRSHVRNLVALRRALPGLASHDWTPLRVAPSAALFGYLRGGETDPVLVVLNFGPEDVEARIDLDGLPSGVREIEGWRDWFRDTVNGPTHDRPDSRGQRAGDDRSRSAPTNGQVSDLPGRTAEMEMPAWGVRVLVPDGEEAR